ncbi:MAG: hypothetical protein HXN56_07960 [Prevotella nigrescens]|nr:hypothetical protein [Prevotella nigrescens]
MYEWTFDNLTVDEASVRLLGNLLCTSCQEVHREESRQAKLLNARDFATGAGKGGLWKLCRKHLHL